MQDTASAYFASMVASYDSLIRRAVPRYDEMLARLVEYLPAAPGRILELGCGTGNFSVALSRRYPDASITWVDASEEMLEVTRERVGGRGSFIASRFEDLQPQPQSFDLITSTISLHHVADKEALFNALFAALAPRGSLCFSDQMRGGSEANHALNWSRWLAYCREPGNCTEEEIASLLDHAAAHDHYTTLSEHFRILECAGFSNIDCVWRNWMWAVVTAE